MLPKNYQIRKYNRYFYGELLIIIGINETIIMINKPKN